MTTTNNFSPHMPMTCAEVARLAHVPHAHAREEAFKLITVLHEKDWITEGIDYEWDTEGDCLSMTTVLGCFVAERLSPVAHYVMTIQRVLADEEEANA